MEQTRSVQRSKIRFDKELVLSYSVAQARDVDDEATQRGSFRYGDALRESLNRVSAFRESIPTEYSLEEDPKDREIRRLRAQVRELKAQIETSESPKKGKQTEKKGPCRQKSSLQVLN